MKQTDQYVNIMLDSLHKKDEILEEIIKENKVQAELASKENLDMDAFSESVERKQKHIDRLNMMDDGFQTLYDKVKIDITENKSQYAEEIRQMQECIKILSEKSILIQGQEEKNRLSIQAHFAKMKKEVKVAKQSMKVASDYYKTMSKTTIIGSQFMDRKK